MKPPIDFYNERVCPSCGKIIKIDYHFCKYCGVSLAEIQPMGKSDDSISINLANSALTDPDAEVRREAIDTLGDFKDTKVLGVLTLVLFNDADETVRAEAADELGDLHHPYSMNALSLALKDPSVLVRKEAIEGLKKIKKKNKEKIIEEQGKSDKKRIEVKISEKKIIREKPKGRLDRYKRMYGPYAKDLLEILEREVLPSLGLSLKELKYKLVHSANYQSGKFKNFNIDRMILTLQDVFPEIFQTEFFQVKNLNQRLIEVLNDQSVKEMMDLFETTERAQWGDDGFQKRFRALEKQINNAHLYLRIIGTYYTKEKLDSVVDVLRNHVLRHPCYTIRTGALPILFDYSQNYKKRIEQFQLEEFFNYLPSGPFYRDIVEKNFIDSILDPAEILTNIAFILQERGTKEQQVRYKAWFSTLYEYLGEKEYNGYYDFIFRRREFWDPF